LNRTPPVAHSADAINGDEPALKVITIYQDPLTRQWAEELWGRVGELVGQEGICHQSRRISELTKPEVFADSVRAATEADVLVISIRDAGELPMSLYVWIDAWVPHRDRHEGALVALIGVPPQPDARSGRAHAFLETVARRAGLDFLPRERKLPGKPAVLSKVAALRPPGVFTMPWAKSLVRNGHGLRLS
jgi:hypothetical protein